MRKAWALLLIVVVAACGGSTEASGPATTDAHPARASAPTTATAATAAADVAPEALAEAEQAAPADQGRASPSFAPGEVIEEETNTDFDYADYEQLVEFALASIDQYWAQVLPDEFGIDYTRPDAFIYYRGESGPFCGDTRLGPDNAFYCPDGDFIAWDEEGLLIPYYLSGDFAAAYVLAHEFGHAVQERLGLEGASIQVELQADCFAGAWARSADEENLLEAGDLDEAVMALYQGRDVPGTPWTDESAHGSAFERNKAFAAGYDGGPQSCLAYTD